MPGPRGDSMVKRSNQPHAPQSVTSCCERLEVTDVHDSRTHVLQAWQSEADGREVCSERYWTLVAEFEVDSIDKFMAMDNSPEMKELEPLMKGYHDLVDHGRREVYKIEA